MLPLAFACSSDSNATPVSPETVEMEAATAESGELEATTSELGGWTKVCHLLPKTRRNGETGDFAFKIVRVQQKAVLRHLGHGDVKNACSDAMAVGEDCWDCAVTFPPT
jgi:hypothetical protein